MRSDGAKYVIRFVGDPCGYFVREMPSLDPGERWIQAEIGITEIHVWVNVAQAYVVEAHE